MNDPLDGPRGPETHREQVILRAQRDLLKIREIPGNAVRQRQRAVGVELRLKTCEAVHAKSVKTACNAATIPSGIRGQAYEVEPISKNQSNEEHAREEASQPHGRTLCLAEASNQLGTLPHSPARVAL